MQPEIHEIEFPQIKGFEERQISNGASVYVMKEGTQPVVKIDIYIKAGSLKAVKGGVAKAAAKLIGEGTHEMTSEQIAEALDYRGAYISEITSQHYTHLSILCLTKHISDIIKIVRDMIVAPTFPQHDIDIYINRSREEYKVNKQRSKFVTNRALHKALFAEGNRYGRVAEDDDLDKITRADIVDFHQRYYSPQGAKIFISGSPTESDIETIITTLDETWRCPMAESDEIVFEANKIGTPISVAMDDAKQASISIGRLTIDVHHPDYCGLTILTTLLGGYFGSRLMSNLREEKGLTYGIGAQLNGDLGFSTLKITSELRLESIDTAINEIAKEMKRLQNELVEDEELYTLTNYIKGDIVRSFENAITTADTLSHSIVMNYKNDFYQQMFNLCDTITAEEIMRLANKYLKIEDFQIVKSMMREK